jgi:aminoglycoside 6'-N-acetyltransferase I
MNDVSPPSAGRPPHPLALGLIARLRERSGARILEIGAGSGRNTTALRDAGFTVEDYDERLDRRYAGALSTHALLHGTPASIAQRLDAIAKALEPGAPLYATFGSMRDARHGEGRRLEEYVFAPVDGDERGVAHTYFDDQRLAKMLETRFAIEALDEVGVDRVAGQWAHEQVPLRGAIHWFALLHAPSDDGNVRRVRAADAQPWLEMRNRLWPQAERADLGDEIDRHFAGDPPLDHVFVYEEAGGTLSGMLELSLRSHADGCASSPVPFIEAWFVHERARRRGVGTALVRAAEYWALAHGFTEIASDTQIGNERSIRAHKALGFDEVERAVYFRRGLVARE